MAPIKEGAARREHASCTHSNLSRTVNPSSWDLSLVNLDRSHACCFESWLDHSLAPGACVRGIFVGVLCRNEDLGDLYEWTQPLCRSLRVWILLGLTPCACEPFRMWSCIPSRPRARKSRPPPSSAQPRREARRARWTGATDPLNRACLTPAPSRPGTCFQGLGLRVYGLRFGLRSWR